MDQYVIMEVKLGDKNLSFGNGGSYKSIMHFARHLKMVRRRDPNAEVRFIVCTQHKGEWVNVSNIQD